MSNDKVQVYVEMTRQMGIEIEEHCINSGETISAYFSRLHESAKAKSYTLNPNFKLDEASKEELKKGNMPIVLVNENQKKKVKK